MGRKYTIEGQRKVQNKEGQRLDSGDGDLEGILERVGREAVLDFDR